MTRLSTYSGEQQALIRAQETPNGGDASQAEPASPDTRPEHDSRGEPAKPSDKPLPDLPNPAEVGEDG
ncbi:hypothetical protein [Trinickia diaoshuihuensis]|jgi:hypothetical protein|uniref:hypothetical protein n=1 Tax=Trinickia diaoshuihuensis TaxID=2292265 RepID=UPI000E226E78|nr:hypothetical protein [Trinickia diaoshuihuensis]